MSNLFGRNFELEVSKGKVAGHTVEILRGHNPDIDTAAQEDIWEAGGELSYLSSAETMEIASSDANDTSAGTGLRTILIKGVDGSGAAATETVTLNGTSDVTTANSYLRVNMMVGLTCGSGNTNAGNITATATTAGTVQCEADAGEAVSQNSHYTVPTGKSAYLYQVELNAAKTGGGGSPVIEFFGFARSASSGVPWIQLFDKKMDVSVQDELDVYIPIPSKLAAGTDLRLAATTDANNTEVRSRMYLMVVDD